MIISYEIIADIYELLATNISWTKLDNFNSLLVLEEPVCRLFRGDNKRCWSQQNSDEFRSSAQRLNISSLVLAYLNDTDYHSGQNCHFD